MTTRETRRRIVAWTSAAALVAGAVTAQSSQQPTFRTGTALLTVDVAVFDGDGRPVAGLDVADFQVTVNGRPQPVKVVSYLEARGELTPADAPRAPQRPAWDGRVGRQTVTNDGVVGPSATTGEDRAFVIMFDDLSMAPTRGQRLALAAQKFVAALPPGDPVGVVRSSNALEALNPTLDRDKVLATIRRAAGAAGEMVALRPQGSEEETNPGADGYVGKAQALDIDEGMLEPLKAAIAMACFNGRRTEVDSQVIDVLIAENHCASQVRMQARQTAALVKRQAQMQIDVIAAVLKGMGSADGIRHLVLVSDGLAVGRVADRLKPLARAAAASGVQVSVLMEEPDLSLGDEGRRAIKPVVEGSQPSPQVDIGAAQRRIEDQRMEMDGLRTATDMMGGQFYRVVGDPMPFFERVRTASAAIYRIGVEPPAGLQPGRELSVDARVKRSGVSVFVNRHALVPAPADIPKLLTTEDRLEAAIAGAEQHGAVPLRVATLLRRAPGNAASVEVTISLDAGGDATPIRGPLTTLFSFAPAAGAAAAPGAAMPGGRRTITATPQGLYQSTFAIAVPPGAYQLRVAVADADGALGAVVTDLDAELPTLGVFHTSDLLVAWVDAQGRPQLLALEPVPAGATGVRAELELYPPPTGVSLDAVQVELSLTRAGEADPLDERIVTPRDVNGAWRVAAEFDAATIPAGRYMLRARVLVDDAVVGTAVATVTKR